MSFHAEVLAREQLEVLRQLAKPATECGFYLGGGTALAAQLGHRQSQDLDWFTAGRIDDPLALARGFRDRGVDLRVAGVGRATLQGELHGVRASFLEYPHPTLVPPGMWPEVGCEVASLDDLAAMKLLAIDQRGAKRDFVDLHAIASNGRPLGEMLELYRRKFSLEDISRVLYSLTYFDDAEVEPMPRMMTDIEWEKVKADIRAWVSAVTMGP